MQLKTLKRALKARIETSGEKIALSAAAVSDNGQAVIIPGSPYKGKTTVAAWLLSKGYQYLTDKLLFLTPTTDCVDYFSCPMVLHNDTAKTLLALMGIEETQILRDRDKIIIHESKLPCAAENSRHPAALMLHPVFAPGEEITLIPLSSGQATAELMACILNARSLPNHGFFQAAALARTIPSYQVSYGDYVQLEGVLDLFINQVTASDLDREALQKLAGTLCANRPKIKKTATPSKTPSASQSPPIPAPTPMGAKRKLTIGMATFDDFDGVYFSVQAIRMYHPEVTKETEIIVIDNHPEGPASNPLKTLEAQIPGYRYIPFNRFHSTAVRDLVFREANADFVLCMDSHVLIYPGALAKLLEYYNRHPETLDLLHGPMLNDGQNATSTHYNPTWGAGMYGQWGSDDRGQDIENEPFEIQMQGLGLFTCRKRAWPGFNPRFIGFGGEEGYIHEKIRQQGGKVLCLPFLQWLHRFARPAGVQYPLNWKDRVRNYYIGFTELGLDTEPVDSHFSEHLGKEPFREIKKEVTAEIDNPFFYFDAIYCINLDNQKRRWEKIQHRFKKLGIAHRVRRFSAIETPENHPIGCALSHRQIIAEAYRFKLKNVLVFEDDAIFLEDTLDLMKKAMVELSGRRWTLFYLGGHRWRANHPLVKGCQYLQHPDHRLTTAHALAYHHTIFEKILTDLPDDIDGMKRWLVTEHGIDQYFRYIEGRFIIQPSLASQPVLLGQEDPKYSDRFTL